MPEIDMSSLEILHGFQKGERDVTGPTQSY